MNLSCIKCTRREKCLASPFLLCNARQRISPYSDAGQKSAALYRRKKIAVGDITGLGTVCCSFFNHHAEICYGLTTGETIKISDILPAEGSAYRSVLPGSNFVRPRYLTLDGWTSNEAGPQRKTAAQTEWYITVVPDLEAKYSGNCLQVHVVAEHMAISYHVKSHKEAAAELNQTARDYNFNPAKTFVFGQDVDPDLFIVKFKKTGICDRL